MALRRPTFLKLAAPLVVFAALLAALALANRSDPVPASSPGGDGVGVAAAGDTPALVESLQQAVAQAPGRADGYAALGDAYLQRARETGDASFYSRAERAFTGARRRDPRNQTAVLGAGDAGAGPTRLRRGPASSRSGRSRSRPPPCGPTR